MRTALCVIITLVLASASFAGTNEFTFPGTPCATDGTFPIIYEFPLTLDAHNVGIGFDGNYIWVSAGDYTTGICQFYLYDDMGNLMFTYPQLAGATGWGHRDMCFDGTYMYGSYSTEIHAFDTMNHFFTISQMIIPGSRYWNMGFGLKKGDVETDEEGLETMQTLGRNMAWLIKKINA